MNAPLGALRLLLDHTREILLLVDARSLLILEANAAASALLGFSREALLGKPITELESALQDVFYWEAVLEGNLTELTEVEDLYACVDGSLLPVVKTIRSVEVAGEGWLVLQLRDARAQRKTEDALAQVTSQLRATLEATVDGILVIDLERRIVNMNHRFSAMWGLPEELLMLQDDSRVFGFMAGKVQRPDQYLGRLDEIENNSDGESSDILDLQDGRTFERKSRPQYLRDQIIGRVYSFSDISDRVKFENIIWEQAYFDALTGLPNRRMLRDRLEQEMKKAHRSERMLALMFLDLDLFKEVNDTLGHDMGDMLLKEVSQRLSSCVRETDTVARLGGDEFTVLLSDLRDSTTTERVIRNILQKVSEPFRLGSELAYISASIGITFYPNDADCLEELLRNADQAMYAAKQQGRNRFSYFTPSMQEAAQSRMRLVNDLRSAVGEDQFRLYYQPIINLANGEIYKAEALVRWEHPTRGLISPGVFIPIAEEIGLINEIGNWVFHEAAIQVLEWRSKYHPRFQISVNKSPVQFRSDASSQQLWFDHMDTLGLPGQSIVVEITEGLLLEASGDVMEQLCSLRETGMRISLDDFGTGYSSLSYLNKFDIDYLKIDQSFVKNLSPESKNMALCEAIIVMAHKLGMKVIAEGVETEEQRTLLIAAGCDYGQGYLFSRPVPAREFEAFVRALAPVPA